jgi:hypothetical protein
MYFEKLKFWWLACSTVPAPAALRVGDVGWLKPCDHDSNSIVFSWPVAVLSPSTPSNAM